MIRRSLPALLRLRFPRSLFGQIAIAQGIVLIAFAIVLPPIAAHQLHGTADRFVEARLGSATRYLALGVVPTPSHRSLALRPDFDPGFGFEGDDKAYGLFDQQGRVLIHSRAAMIALPPTPPGAGPLFRHVGSHDLYTLPIERDGLRGTLAIAQDRGHPDVLLDSVINAYVGQFWWVISGTMLTALAAAALIARRATRSIAHTASRADHIDTNRLHLRIPEGNAPSEVAPLLRAANRALDRLEQGFREQSEFVADVAHELRTPLAVVSLRAEAIADKATRESVLAALERATHVIDQLMELASVENSRPSFEPLDLAALAEEAVVAQAPLVYRSGRTIELVHVAQPPPVEGNAGLIGIVLNNLIANAMRHTPKGTAIRIETGPGAELAVIDDGPGLKAGGIDAMRPRYRRADTKRTDGAGLGLAIVDKIVKLHRGRLELVPSAKGAHFRIDLGAGERSASGAAA